MRSLPELRMKIFDIRRFSTHDGSGIRTNVFFKGCPLRCVWCQNPEGIDSRIRPIHFAGKCIGCGICLETAKNGGMHEENGIIRIRRDREDCWEELIRNCPAGAIRMDAKEWTVEEVIREVKKDRVFFRNSGGVTLSGGEPLLQGEAAAELLMRLKEEGIHTAIETALHVPLETLQKAVQFLDLIYADLKLADPKEHKRFTGISNEQILINLQWLLASEYRDKVIIRTPLIPGMTATEKNLSRIADFLTGVYPDVKYELLNYNPLAEAKYHLIEKEYCFSDNPKMYTREQMLDFGEIVKKNGIRNLILEL